MTSVVDGEALEPLDQHVLLLDARHRPSAVLNGVAAELGAQRGVDPRGERVLPRDEKRSKSEVVITGIGIRLSIASSTVQRPSPESST